MRYQEFIIEAGVQAYQHKDLSQDQAVEILKTKCSDFLPLVQQKGEKTLYRGMTDFGDYRIVYPSSGSRISQNTTNHYTVLLDNSPYMKEYPRRSKSLICSAGFDYAQGFADPIGKKSSGDTYAVIPFNGSKIGICPQNDIWRTPITVDPNLHFYGYTSMQAFNNWLDDYLNLSAEDVAQEVLTPEAENYCKKFGLNPKYFYQYLYHALSPQRAHWELLSTSEFAATRQYYSDNECWIGDPCLLIRFTSMSAIKDLLADK
jgi:hypothetical protein